MPTATWNDTVIATSDDIVTVESNAYFPADSIDPALIEDSADHLGLSVEGNRAVQDHRRGR